MTDWQSSLLLQNTRIKSSDWKHAFTDMKKSSGQMVVPKFTSHKTNLAWEPTQQEVRKNPSASTLDCIRLHQSMKQKNNFNQWLSNK